MKRASIRALVGCALALSLFVLVAPSTAHASDTEAPAAAEPAPGLVPALNRGLATFNGWVTKTLFFSVTGDYFTAPEFDMDKRPVLAADGTPKRTPVPFPFIVFTLVGGGLFFTLFYGFMNIRGFKHAIAVLRGHFDKPGDAGDVSHFQAFTSALSATVGLGNIAGVAIAIQIGGPGATLWMIVAAFFGMSLKLNSCTLSQLFRRMNPDGTVSGGPMYYLEYGLRQVSPKGWLPMLGKGLAVLYAIMIIGGSFGGGNMFQANQSFGALKAAYDVEPAMGHFFGITLAVLVGLVILGGIRRIGAATSRIVPLMVCLYVLASLYVVAVNIDRLPSTVALIFNMAFSENALYGGTLGVIVKGFQRASFSNEAGVGSAAIAHAAARTDEPVREGLVAMLGPVVDTVVVCTMTALVVTITGVWDDPQLARIGGDLQGVQLTAAAFATVLPWFPAVLTVCVLMFAYSTMISWAYYGERGWIYLVDHLGKGAGFRTLAVYRLAFVVFVYVGTVTKAKHVLEYSDLMILCMALPNVLGGLFLAPTVRRHIRDYMRRLQAGAF